MSIKVQKFKSSKVQKFKSSKVRFKKAEYYVPPVNNIYMNKE